MSLTRRGWLRWLGGGRERRPVLVNVFLRGGADSLHLLVPHGDPDYLRHRPGLGLAEPSQKELELDGFFGLHPDLAALAPMYHDGELAPVCAVGSEDETRSHFEAQDFWERGGDQAQGGWLARHMRSRRRDEATSAFAVVAFAEAVPMALLGAPVAAAISDLADLELSGVEEAWRQGLASLYTSGSGELAASGQRALKAMERIGSLPSNSAVDYPQTAFAHSLQQTARLIHGEVGLEISCIDLGGWDSHFGQETVLAGNLRALAEGLAAFRRDLGTRWEDVTVVVQTEFGRRVYENSSLGTDHGRASCMFLAGGGLRGGRVYGRWPGLSELEGPGDLQVTTDYRSVLSEVLLRRLDNARVDQVFPGFQPSYQGFAA